MINEGSKPPLKTSLLKSVDRSFSLFRCFTHDQQDYSMTELAKKLRVSKGTIHRILLTAIKHGFIEQKPENQRYQLGMKIFELGSVVSKRMNLRGESLPVLKEISNITGETSYLMTIDNYEAICIESVEGHNNLRAMFLELGKRMPLYIGAGPRLLLAYMSESQIEQWLKKVKMMQWTEHTITHPDDLLEDISNIRKKGFAVSIEDNTLGAAAVGAPIRNAEGEVVAAVSIAGQKNNYQDDKLKDMVNIIMDAGRKISYRIGYIECLEASEQEKVTAKNQAE